MIPDDQSRLRKAERDLYAMDIEPPRPRSVLHDKKTDAPTDWRDADDHASAIPPSMHQRSNGSIFKKIFIGSFAILLVAIAIAAVSFLGGTGAISADKVSVTVTARSFVDGGEPLPVDVTITNRNRAALELATLVLEYPAAGTDANGAIARMSRDVGSLGSGDSRVESFSIQLYGEEASVKQITARLEFRVVGSNAVYDQAGTADVTLRTSPIRMTLDAPAETLPNQVIPLAFTITGNGTAALSNVAMIAEYPVGFTFSRAEPAPSTGQNVWYLGDVPPGANRTITVYGSFAGTDGDAATIRASVGAQSARNESQLDQVYNAVARVIPITTAFIDAKISVGGSNTASVPISASQSTQVRIPWENTTASQLSNVEIRVRLEGNAYDPARVNGGSGFFDSTTNEVIFTRQQNETLASVDPGASGNLSFSLTPKTLSGITSNPNIVLTVSVRAVDAGIVRTAQNIDKKTLVIGSDMNLLSRTIHYSGPIQNTGAMPPKRDAETTYTLEWQLTNSRNRITGVRVATTLPTNVAWKNVIVPQTENVSYNEVTRELIWNAGEISAGATKTVAIKVGVTPSASQAGAQAALTNTITITGRDTFTNADISFTRRGLDTRTQNDGAGAGAQGQVQ